jgi:hypothetical protein
MTTEAMPSQLLFNRLTYFSFLLDPHQNLYEVYYKLDLPGLEKVKYTFIQTLFFVRLLYSKAKRK